MIKAKKGKAEKTVRKSLKLAKFFNRLASTLLVRPKEFLELVKTLQNRLKRQKTS